MKENGGKNNPYSWFIRMQKNKSPFLFKKKNIYESFLHFSHSVSIQLAFSKFKPDVDLEFNEAHWKTSERKNTSSSHMLLAHEFEYLKGNLEMRMFPILLTNNSNS